MCTEAFRRLPTLLIALAAMVAGGCGSEAEPPSALHVEARSVPPGAHPTLDRNSLFDEETIARWNATEPKFDVSWRIVGGARESDPRIPGRHLRATAGKLLLQSLTPLPWDHVDAFEIVADGLSNGNLVLSWRCGTTPASTTRTVHVTHRRGIEANRRRFRFELAGGSDWCANPTDLSFALPITAGRRIFLESIQATIRSPNSERLTDAAGRASLMEVGNDQRHGFLITDDAPFSWTTVVPGAGRLRFSFALDQAGRSQGDLVIGVSPMAGKYREVLRTDLATFVSSHRSWTPFDLDLSTFQEQRVTITFAIDGTRNGDELPAIGLLGTPEVLGPGEDRSANVLVIVIDTLRADHLSCYGYDRPTSPFLDRWANDRAVLFENVVAPAPWTLPSHTSLFTGLNAIRHGVNHNTPAPGSLVTMADLLRDQGYATAAITGGGFLRPAFGLNQGFERYSSWPLVKKNRELREGVDRALRWLEEFRDRPHFLFFHTYEVHGPPSEREPFFSELATVPPAEVKYFPRRHDWRDVIYPGEYFVAFDEGRDEPRSGLEFDDFQRIRSMYDSRIAYTDRELQRLFEGLTKLGLGDSTLVVVTSDHGEALGEDGRAGHQYLEDYNLMVPLLIGIPDGRFAGTRVKQQVRLVDVLPTVLDTLAINLPAGIDGASLLPLAAGEPWKGGNRAVSYSGANNKGLALRFDSGWKYRLNNAAWKTLAGRESLFDLRSDPEERRDVSETDPRTAGIRRDAWRFLLDEHRGHRLRLINHGEDHFLGRLSGSWSRVNTVKRVESHGAGLSWAPPDAEFSLAPGDQTTLILEEPGGGPWVIHGALLDVLGGEPLASFDHHLTSLDRHVAFSVERTGIALASSEPRTGFIFEPDVHGGAVSDAAISDTTMEQLRALGYTD
jgi:arylsulfatase A-like enzyme